MSPYHSQQITHPFEIGSIVVSYIVIYKTWIELFKSQITKLKLQINSKSQYQNQKQISECSESNQPD